jgi:hypothetical protein
MFRHSFRRNLKWFFEGPSKLFLSGLRTDKWYDVNIISTQTYMQETKKHGTMYNVECDGVGLSLDHFAPAVP